MKRILSAPTAVDLCITGSCNLSCRHCFAAHKERAQDELTLTQWQFVIDRLAQAKVFTLILTGGEPLTREDFFDIAAYCTRYPFRMGLNTNALLVSDDVSRRIACLGFKARISVSLDGASAHTYEALRGEDTFNKALKGIESLLRFNSNVRLFCVVTKHNFLELEKITNLARSLGASSLEFNSLLRGERAQCYPDLFLDPAQKKHAYEIVLELEKKFGGFISGSFVRMSKKAKLLLSIPKAQLLTHKAGFLQNCDAGFGKAAVTSQGKIAPCYTMLDYIVGDILGESLIEIWKNSSCLKLLRSMHEVSLDSLAQCAPCVYKGLCNAGCRAGAYYHSGKSTLAAHDPEACLLSLENLSS
jgi:AdoMet-dependent heme synthase